MTILASATAIQDAIAALRMLAASGLPVPPRMTASIAATDEAAEALLSSAQRHLELLGADCERDRSRVERLTARFPGGITYVLHRVRLEPRPMAAMSYDRPLAG